MTTTRSDPWAALVEELSGSATAPLRCLPSVSPSWEERADVVVVGAGAAGLSAARVAAAAGRDVVVLVKGDHRSGATAAAQGGLAAVAGAGDTLSLHGADTRSAGAGLCDQDAVAALVSGAPAELAELRRLGARFDLDRAGRPALTREGGHSRDRVVHAGGDASGAEVDRVLRSTLPPTVRVMTPVALVDLLRDPFGSVVGVLAGRYRGGRRARARDLRLEQSSCVRRFLPGLRHDDQPVAVTGDGARQPCGPRHPGGHGVRGVHPTVLWSAEARGQRPLLTEALRGGGAFIVDAMLTGHGGAHPLADLAPRDVVSAAMVER